MNIRLVCLYLHKVCILIAAVMLVCLPFSIPGIGERTDEGMYSTNEPLRFEEDGFMALLMGIIVSAWAVGALGGKDAADFHFFDRHVRR